MNKTRRVLLILLALVVLTGPAKLLLAAMLPAGAVDPVPGCIAGMVLTLLTMGLPAWLLYPWESVRLTRQKSLLPGLAMAILAAVTVRFGFQRIDVAWQMLTGAMPEPLPVPDSVPLAMLYIAALAIVPALTEEAFFRGALLTGLLDGSRRVTAVLLTTVAFALMHGNLAHLPSLLMLSALLTLLMLHTGHIAVPMAAHLMYNLTALNGIAVPGWGGVLCYGGAGILCGWLLLRRTKVAHPPMKAADGLIAAAAIAVLILSYLI